LRDLVAAGVLQAEQHLRTGRHRFTDAVAIVAADGRLSADAKLYDSPSGAGKGVIKPRTVNGWMFWCVDTIDGPRLWDVRRQLLGPDNDRDYDEPDK
jgi:hypothetical protein